MQLTEKAEKAEKAEKQEIKLTKEQREIAKDLPLENLAKSYP